MIRLWVELDVFRLKMISPGFVLIIYTVKFGLVDFIELDLIKVFEEPWFREPRS